MKPWTFSVDNLLKLRGSIKEEDKAEFDYIIDNIPRVDFFTKALIVCKEVLLNESMDKLPKARAHASRLRLLDKIVKILLAALFLWYVLTSRAAATCWEAISELIY